MNKIVPLSRSDFQENEKRRRQQQQNMSVLFVCHVLLSVKALRFVASVKTFQTFKLSPRKSKVFDFFIFCSAYI